MSFLIGAFKVIFLIGFLVFIHEGGHFLMAKASKVFVKEFAIGFGPKIFSWQGKETTYSIRLVPLGGFVNMLGEEERSDEEGSFSKAKLLNRMAIVLAGPAVNIVFGLIVYFILLAIMGNNISTKIDYFDDTYTSASQYLQAGDDILEINGKKIHIKSEIDKAMKKSDGGKVTVKVRRENEIIEETFTPDVMETKALGIYFSNSGAKIKYIEDGSSAKLAGLEIGDIITKINDTEITNYLDISKAMSEVETDSIKIEVKRKLETLDFDLIPKTNKTYVLGVYLKMAENNFANNVYYGFWETTYFWDDLMANFKQIFTQGINMDQMTGPIGISEMVVETNGVFDFVNLMCMISLSLGITNLLPIPALDGGRFILLAIEGVRRKPLNENLELQIQMIGFTVLILFSLYVSYKDILRIF